MKCLFLLPGTPIYSLLADDELNVELPTLVQGNRRFYKWELINNLQSVAGILQSGKVMGDVFSFSSRKNPVHLIKSGFRIRQLVKQNKIDKVVVFWGGLSAFITSLFSPVSVIVIFLGSDLQGSYSPNGKQNAFGKLLIFFSKLACKKATGLVVMSQKMAALIPKKQQYKVLVLPEGVDFNKFYPIDKNTCRKRLGWPLNEPVVLFFNNGNAVKNASLAQAAFKLLAQQMPQVQLKEVVGIPHHELVYYYNAADLLLLTSLHEGSNNSLKEAMACNCPVVASSVGDAAERLQNVYPGAVTPNFSATVFAKAMQQVLETGRRSNGREKVASVSVQQVGEKMSEFLMKPSPKQK